MVAIFYWRYGKHGSHQLSRDEKVEEFVARRCKLPAKGWAVTFRLTYLARNGEKRIGVCRINTKRGGVRVFRTLENLARQLQNYGVQDFKVDLSQIDEVVLNETI